MITIAAHGITYIEPLDGSREWYWGTDYIHGDLYEAEELYRDHHPVNSNCLIFVHYPDGRVVEPIKGQSGQLVDFPQSNIRVFQYDDAANQTIEIVTLPVTAVENCYNLLLRRYPLMVTRDANDGKFQIVGPETVEIEIEEPETFVDRKGDYLYFSKWHEKPKYREEIVVRKYPTGEITEIIPGSWTQMPNGQIWILQ